MSSGLRKELEEIVNNNPACVALPAGLSVPIRHVPTVVKDLCRQIRTKPDMFAVPQRRYEPEELITIIDRLFALFAEAEDAFISAEELVSMILCLGILSAVDEPVS